MADMAAHGGRLRPGDADLGLRHGARDHGALHHWRLHLVEEAARQDQKSARSSRRQSGPSKPQLALDSECCVVVGDRRAAYTAIA